MEIADISLSQESVEPKGEAQDEYCEDDNEAEKSIEDIIKNNDVSADVGDLSHIIEEIDPCEGDGEGTKLPHLTSFQVEIYFVVLI